MGQELVTLRVRDFSRGAADAGNPYGAVIEIVAARAEDVALIIERAGSTKFIQRVHMDLQPDLAASCAEVLAGPGRGRTALIGSTRCGQWVSGPFTGQAAP